MLHFRRDTPLKKLTIVLAVSALAVVMVLPVVRSVNLSAGKPITTDKTLSADGWPQPPLPPPPGGGARTLVADGWPQPPLPPPPGGGAQMLIADGWPQPPLPPPPGGEAMAFVVS